MTQRYDDDKGRAPLQNLFLLHQAAIRLIERQPGLPGLGVMYGVSGLGKTQAALHTITRTRAIYVEMRYSWNRKDFLQAVLKECEYRQPRGTISQLAAQIVTSLGQNPERPLIIDEADFLVERNMIEFVREFYEHAQAPIILIGEENLPVKLKRHERVYNRVLEWVGAVDCNIEDARALAEHVMPGIAISDRLLKLVLTAGDGKARRCVTTFNGMREWARNTGATSIADNWTGHVSSDEPPRRVRGAV